MSILSYEFKEEVRQIAREEVLLNRQKPDPEPLIIRDIRNQRKTCEALDITEPTIIRWRNKGKIPFMQIGSSIRYDLNAVIKALEVTNKKGAGRG